MIRKENERRIFSEEVLYMNHKQRIQKAHKQAKKDFSMQKQDHHRQAFHIDPPSNWLNDPNGLVFFQNEYHVFFQYGPYSVSEGARHWGHYKSKDLVHWKALPPALAPGETYDRDGCFSGSAVVHNDQLYLIYTGHLDDASPKETQCVAISEDGVNFTKYAHNPVIKEKPRSEFSEDFRDPKVWKQDDIYHMIVGNNHDGSGQALLYQSSDLLNWEYQGVFAKSVGDQGFMWECPDFIQVDGDHYLILSPEGMDGVNHKSIYLQGEYDQDQKKFNQVSHHLIDYGTDFYAPQTFVDYKGRTIMFGWLNLWESSFPTSNAGFVGSLTIPRELHSRKGKLIQEPVEELKKLRQEKIEVELAGTVEQEIEQKLEVGEFDLTFHWSKGDEFVRLFLRTSKDRTEKTVVSLHVDSQRLSVDRENSGEGDTSGVSMPIDFSAKTCHLRIFMDRTSLEIFAEEGEKVFSTRIYPHEDSQAVHVEMGGSNPKLNLQAWKLRDVMGGIYS